MRVLLHAVDLSPARFRQAIIQSGSYCELFGPPQDMCSALYRDPEACGIILTQSPTFAEMTCRAWRHADLKSILFVLIDFEIVGTAEARMRARILDAGADDVQPSAIDIREFDARLSALLQRDRGPDAEIIRLPAEAVFNPATGMVTSSLGMVQLSIKEGELLKILTDRPGVVITKETILDRMYGGRDEPELKIVDVFICKLRKKLESVLGNLDAIRSIWGRGYEFVPEGFIPNRNSRQRMVG